MTKGSAIYVAVVTAFLPLWALAQSQPSELVVSVTEVVLVPPTSGELEPFDEAAEHGVYQITDPWTNDGTFVVPLNVSSVELAKHMDRMGTVPSQTVVSTHVSLAVVPFQSEEAGDYLE